jgi:hypothetical protein
MCFFCDFGLPSTPTNHPKPSVTRSYIKQDYKRAQLYKTLHLHFSRSNARDFGALKRPFANVSKEVSIKVEGHANGRVSNKLNQLKIRFNARLITTGGEQRATQIDPKRALISSGWVISRKL